MALYAIGDVQGCFDALRALLDKLRFDPTCDTLWFTGDLVNRGPQSLDVLRFVAGLGAHAVTVLGNHDLHLLAVATGCAKPKTRDTLGAILTAPDREALLDWLRRRPLLHMDVTRNLALVHAGLVPQWSIDEARALASEVEVALRGPNTIQFFRYMYGDAPDRWHTELRGYERLRFIVNVLTRLRYCDANGRIELSQKGAPGSQPPPWVPWYSVDARRSRGTRIVFGHWSTLGLHRENGVFGLDTGCVWGGKLTALRLDGEGAPVEVVCRRQSPIS